ncbi:hypothetical protein L202_07753 [Cryptococcus amylolentus CBS 6039]|uniref:Uncharacterized protein n=1 Tax=Cryptococcus amylolentus CBS 6039 TaxID=1295533 RepID=A0A1E3HA14_9TREE|nr:hypothetical protein L202_07753 [Cryptococcus amylolentus CBS 6039]ODN73192.1 hypothetical protein L202_07753 [Cryptococcus amylolentus CBS 6039]
MSGSPSPITLTFDTTHNLQLDAYLPFPQPSSQTKLPVVVHYHRGGMVIGSKSDVYPPFLPGYLQSMGVLLVSPNYRLLFPSSAEDIIADVHSLFAYLAAPNTELDETLRQNGFAIDVSRIAVIGVSGGNYPARAAATLPEIVPRPVAWLDLFGMGGDWLLDFWLQGIDVEKTMPLENTLHDMAKAEDLIQNGGGDVASESEGTLVDGKATDVIGRFNLWIHWQKEGTFLDYVLSSPGLSSTLKRMPYGERLALIPPDKRRFLLPITPQTPPTYVLHGDQDLLVPIEESYALVNDMKTLGLSVKGVWVPGADHVLRDRKKGGWEGMVDGWEEIAREAVNWVVAEVRRERR